MAFKTHPQEGDSTPSEDLIGEGLEEMTLIGEGGFGRVYRAYQRQFNRYVAVKVLTTGALKAESNERFKRECLAVGALSGHPNIVTVYGSGLAGLSRPYISMAYMAGGSLADRIQRNGPLGWEEASDVGIRIAGALETAHRAKILHRDIKPENLLVSDYAEPMLGDFGVSSVPGGYQTSSGVITASVAHAPPEILGGSRANEASDIYSLASTIFTLISGRLAFARRDEESLPSLITRVLVKPIPDLRPEGVPDSICKVLEHAMEKAPGKRPRSAEEFGGLLQQALRSEGLTPAEMQIGSPDIDDESDDARDLRMALEGIDHESLERSDNFTGVTLARPRPGTRQPRASSNPSRAKRRKWLIPIAAATAIIALAAAALINSPDRGRRAGSKKVANRAELRLLKVTLPNGLTIERIWSLEGGKGDRFVSKVVVGNETSAPISGEIDEVVPKSLASSVAEIDFEPQPAQVILADPIFRYTPTVDPGDKFRFQYLIEVPAKGAKRSRLVAWALDRDQAEKAYNPEAPSTTPPEAIPDPGGTAPEPPGGTPPVSVNPPSLAPPGAPAAPESVTCIAGKEQVTVKWGSSNGATSYRVYDSSTKLLRETGALSDTETQLTPGKSYIFKVSAKGPAGESSMVSCAPVTVLYPDPLPAPASVQATGGQLQAMPLNWSGVAGAVSYSVVVDGSTYATGVTATSLTISNGGWPPCTQHSAYVLAVDKYGQKSGPSPTATATTGDRAPRTTKGTSVAEGFRAGMTHHRSVNQYFADDDPGDALNYILVEHGFSATTFKFCWGSGGWGSPNCNINNNPAGDYWITVPSGNGGASYMKFKVRDRCGAETAIVYMSMDWVA